MQEDIVQDEESSDINYDSTIDQNSNLGYQTTDQISDHIGHKIRAIEVN